MGGEPKALPIIIAVPALLGKQLNDEDPMVPSVVETGPLKDKKQNEEN